MNREDLISGIRKVWEFSQVLDLGEVFANPIPLEPSDDFVASAFDPECSYENLYLTALQNGDYNIQLVDFSFFQFGISQEDHVRFAYYPNPFLGSSTTAIAEVNELREYVAEGIVTVEQFLQRISEIRNSQHAPLLRYENAPEQYVQFSHPCSHFHFGHHSENRWQIQRVLTPLSFAMIVFQQFHRSKWHDARAVTAFGKTELPRVFLSAEKLNCRILPDELFSPEEKLLFSIA
ncbi:MAG: DUF2290 domain-containing protein [Bradyrhizobium sp.]|uniref:DUF2290 domain-containing protein n=1 Tax=Bradyrhizobium sp. TaxID=376 RepID=UPI0029BECB66|nr:DUF2290 domain-containing protein [Bradyrhizobium sp.]MDX3967665.1 DUF2290 domain-containing protein [Bradyrhizobium sp.]